MITICAAYESSAYTSALALTLVGIEDFFFTGLARGTAGAEMVVDNWEAGILAAEADLITCRCEAGADVVADSCLPLATLRTAAGGWDAVLAWEMEVRGGEEGVEEEVVIPVDGTGIEMDGSVCFCLTLTFGCGN